MIEIKEQDDNIVTYIEETATTLLLLKEMIHEELKTLAKGFKPNWEDKEEEKFYICTYSTDEVGIASVYDNIIANTIYFRTEDDICKAIDKIGDRTLLRYYFEII